MLYDWFKHCSLAVESYSICPCKLYKNQRGGQNIELSCSLPWETFGVLVWLTAIMKFQLTGVWSSPALCDKSRLHGLKENEVCVLRGCGCLSAVCCMLSSNEWFYSSLGNGYCVCAEAFWSMYLYWTYNACIIIITASFIFVESDGPESCLNNPDDYMYINEIYMVVVACHIMILYRSLEFALSYTMKYVMVRYSELADRKWTSKYIMLSCAPTATNRVFFCKHWEVTWTL